MSTKNIYQKLLEIQKQVKGLSKDKKSHNYDYVTGNKLLSFIKPLMDEQGLILKQEILSIDNERQDYDTKYGKKSEILSKVMMRFTWSKWSKRLGERFRLCSNLRRKIFFIKILSHCN
jgi:hypothetical protein